MTLEVDGARHEPDRVVHLVRQHIPGAVFVRCAAAEISMRLPLDSTALFADMLDDLEANKPALGLSYYSISMPSLVSSSFPQVLGRQQQVYIMALDLCGRFLPDFLNRAF